MFRQRWQKIVAEAVVATTGGSVSSLILFFFNLRIKPVLGNKDLHVQDGLL